MGHRRIAAGHKARGAVMRFRARLAPALTERLNLTQLWEKLVLEAVLAKAFLDAGVTRVEHGN